ncbi:MAG: non-homologous end-joining DNA ligase [Actinomycetota bacterium]
MLPTLVSQPYDHPDHLFEVKWDGVRVLAFCRSGSTRLYSRSGREVTHQYPEFADLHGRLHLPDAVLDGEIVALDAAARPSFELLQSRINLSRPSDIARAISAVRLDLVLFDLPFAAGEWIGDTPLESRAERLGRGIDFSGRVLRSEAIPQAGTALFGAAKAKGLEGVVGKHRLSRYLPGKRTKEWLKIKAVYEIDAVIGGFSAGAGHRSAWLGALLVGAYDTEDRLRYLGSVGTGFSERTLAELLARLSGRAAPSSPFAGQVPEKGVTWVRPELVCVVEYRELTSGMKLRAPSFKGLRQDKLPEQCRVGSRSEAP